MGTYEEVAIIDFDACVKETELAICIEIDGDSQWIPRSLIDGDPPEKGDGDGTILVALWFAEKEGLV
jgi:hypothetical protein